MSYNYLFIDTETTGVDEKLDSIIQMAGFLRVDGVEVEKFNWKVKPYNLNPVSLSATAIHGVTNEEAQTYPDGREAFEGFKDMLERHGIGPDNKANVVGYNVAFDVTMLKGMFQRYGKFNLWDYIWSPSIDVMQMAYMPFSRHRDVLANFRLGTVYAFAFDETFDDAHDAFADIRATERLFDFLNDRFFGGMYLGTHPKEPDPQPRLFDDRTGIPVRRVS